MSSYIKVMLNTKV